MSGSGLVVDCQIDTISSELNGAALRNSAPAIAAEGDSTAVVVTAKDGGVLFRSTKFRIIGMQYSHASHALFLFGEEVRYWGCCHYCKDPDRFGGIVFCRRCLDKGWWVVDDNGAWTYSDCRTYGWWRIGC